MLSVHNNNDVVVDDTIVRCHFIAAAYVERKFANIALFEDLYANVVRKMESVFESYLGGVQDGITAVVSEQQPDDIPKTHDPVYILGKKYCAIQGEPLYYLRILCT